MTKPTVVSIEVRCWYCDRLLAEVAVEDQTNSDALRIACSCVITQRVYLKPIIQAEVD